jgi:hypothetical protein
VASVPTTITCKNTAGNALEGVRVRIEEDPSGTLISQGTTNASGVVSDTFGGATPQASKIIARLLGLVDSSAFETIQSGTGMSVPISMGSSVADLPG